MKNKKIVMEAQMLIRKPVSEVFNAFTDPEQTKNFWFTGGSGKLEADKEITWHWEMYNLSVKVNVKEVINNKRISILWNNPEENVDFIFTPSEDGASTYVVIKNYGFVQEGDQLLKKLIDTTGGFTTVLDGAKCWLEHGIRLNLVRDKFPAAFTQHT